MHLRDLIWACYGYDIHKCPIVVWGGGAGGYLRIGMDYKAYLLSYKLLND